MCQGGVARHPSLAWMWAGYIGSKSTRSKTNSKHTTKLQKELEGHGTGRKQSGACGNVEQHVG